MLNKHVNIAPLSAIADYTNKITMIIMAILLATSTLFMFAQVVLRYVWSLGFDWVEELIRYSGISFAVLGICPLTRFGAHVKVDLFSNRLEKHAIVRAVLYFFELFCLVVLLVEGVSLVKFGMRAMTTGLRIPFGYVYLAIPIGAFLGIVQLADILINNAGRPRKEQEE